MKKTLTLAALALTMGFSLAQAPANAAGLNLAQPAVATTETSASVEQVKFRGNHKFGGFKKFGHFKHHYYYKPYVYGHYAGPSCHYFKNKWHYTGSFHWKKKYYLCKGWW